MKLSHLRSHANEECRSQKCGPTQAAASDQAAWDRALRPKPCKLACHPALRCTISMKLRRRRSPEQITGRLKRVFPGEPQNQVSRETVYRGLYI